MNNLGFSSGADGWAILADGTVEFNDGNFRGDITGATGTFSGLLSVGSGCKVDSSGNVWWGASSAYAGATNKNSSAGVVTLTSGTFAGSLSAAGGTFAGTLSAVDGTFTGTLSAVGGTFTGTVSAGTITGGTINIGSGTFQVDASGNVTATSITATGSITAGAGSDLPFSYVTAGTIGNEILKLGNSASSIVQSNTFVSDTSGWAIRGDGYAEFNDVKIRGDLVAGTIDIGTNAFQVDTNGNMWLGAAVFESAIFSVDTNGNVIMDGDVTIGGTVQHDTAGWSLRLANQGAGAPNEGGEIRFDAPNNGGDRVHLDIFRISQFGVTTTNWFRFVNAVSATQMFAVDEDGNAIIFGATNGYAMIQLGQSSTGSNNAWLRSGTGGDFQVYYAESAQAASNEGFKIGSGGNIYFPNIATSSDSGLNTIRHKATASTPDYEIVAYTSSRRFKQNLHSLNGVLAAEGTRSRLYHPQLEPTLYKSLEAEGNDHWNASLITEDVAEVFPEWVTLGGDGLPFVYGETGLVTHMLAELRNLRAELDWVRTQLDPTYQPPAISPVPAEELQRLQRHAELLVALQPIMGDTVEERDEAIAARLEAEAAIPELLRAEFPVPA